jgi:hypothetical protein
MIATNHTVGRAARHDLAGQLAVLGIDDPLWVPMMLKTLAQGGCIVIERTGDLLMMPIPDPELGT